MAHVEYFVLKAFYSFEHMDNGASDIDNMNEGSPEVLLINDQIALVDGLPAEVVDHEVETRARGQPIGRRKPQCSRSISFETKLLRFRLYSPIQA